VVEVVAASPDLDSIGRVIDFSEVKRIVGGWIDEELDHNMLLHPDDPLATRHSAVELVGRLPFIMPRHLSNPTAENLAQLVYEKANELLASRGIKVVRVRFYETPNGWSDYPGLPLTRSEVS
jgi:6-pyruvoyltetrahydropterin/6-carboxytetrahydropterin synthase